MSMIKETTKENGERFVFVQGYDFVRIAQAGSGSIAFAAPGYWSQDIITLYVRRDFQFNLKAPRDANDEERWVHEWKLEMSHSSGGRDKKDIADDLDAEAWFATALTKAISIGFEIRAQFAEMEKLYQAQRLLDMARDKQASDEKQRLIDADPALTSEEAKCMTVELASALKAAAENQWTTYVGHVYARVRGTDGKKDPIAVTAKRNYGVTRWYFCNSIISVAKAQQLLSERAANGAHVSDVTTN